jgi:hypothetical protein
MAKTIEEHFPHALNIAAVKRNSQEQCDINHFPFEFNVMTQPGKSKVCSSWQSNEYCRNHTLKSSQVTSVMPSEWHAFDEGKQATKTK